MIGPGENPAIGVTDRLRRFGVRPSSIKLPDGSSPKGYLRSWFDDPFRRYLPPSIRNRRNLGSTKPKTRG